MAETQELVARRLIYVLLSWWIAALIAARLHLPINSYIAGATILAVLCVVIGTLAGRRRPPQPP